MDGPVFDAMLKNALEEAIRRDLEESPTPPRPSRRQRRRMRRLLADARTERRSRNPARWLAAVVAAALLTGAAAAGLALGSGERFQRMFEEDAAGYYGGAADTEQLLDMGAEMGTALLESGGLRFEMLDAVFDGQRAMMELRMTLLDPAVQERAREKAPNFGDTGILLENGRDVNSWSWSVTSREAGGMEEELEEGQYSLVFSISDEALNAGGRCGIQLRDLVSGFGEEQEVLLSGEWTLSVTLRPTELLRLEPGAVCRVNGVEWLLDGVTLSPLALSLTLHREEGGEPRSHWLPDLSIRVKGGEVLELHGSTGVSSTNTHMDVQKEFHMPLDLEQVESLLVCGVEIPLWE